MNLDWSASPVQPGDVIAGKFKVEQVLGSGGVGVVVAARHLQLDERVALKFLLPEAVRSEVDIARFCREAQATVRLRSEHVARVIDVGTLETGSPYMVMEYLTGTDLGELLEENGPLPPATAIDYVLQACEAIAEAHSVGFVHRDIKPSNLYLTRRSDGSPLVKVLDFGIAKATHQTRIGEGEQDLTRTRTMLGSPLYMSPEQVRNSKTVDERTDLWSIGIVLYELLSGRVPYEADSVTGVVAAVIGDPLPPLQERRPGLPAGLVEVIETCLQKKPNDRYQSVAELAYALLPFADASSRLSVDRIAGTLGTKAKYRSARAPRRGANSHLVAATTVSSGDTQRLRRGPLLRRVAAAALVTSLVIAATLVILRATTTTPGLDGAASPPPDPEPTTASKVIEAEMVRPLVVPAEMPEAPATSASAAPSAASSASAISAFQPPAPTGQPVRPSTATPSRFPAARPLGSARWSSPVAPTPTAKSTLTATAPQRHGVIDATVDTRR